MQYALLRLGGDDPARRSSAMARSKSSRESKRSRPRRSAGRRDSVQSPAGRGRPTSCETLRPDRLLIASQPCAPETRWSSETGVPWQAHRSSTMTLHPRGDLIYRSAYGPTGWRVSKVAAASALALSRHRSRFILRGPGSRPGSRRDGRRAVHASDLRSHRTTCQFIEAGAGCPASPPRCVRPATAHHAAGISRVCLGMNSGVPEGRWSRRSESLSPRRLRYQGSYDLPQCDF